MVVKLYKKAALAFSGRFLLLTKNETLLNLRPGL